MYLRSCFLFWVCCQSAVVSLDIGGNEALSEDLTSCLATVIGKECPECTTIHLILPLTPVWQSDGLAELLTNGDPMYALVISTIDEAGQRDFSFQYLTLYLIIDERDFRAALSLAYRERSNRRSVVLLDYNYDRDLFEYIWSFIEARWNRFRNVVFVSFRNGQVEVVGMTKRKPGPNEFAQLHLCNKVEVQDAIVEPPQEPDRKIQLMVYPSVYPYVEPQDDQSGGMIGNIEQILTDKFHVRPKYLQGKNYKETENFAENHNESISINFVSMAKMTDETHVLTPLVDLDFWVVMNENAQPLPFWKGFMNTTVWAIVIQFVIHAMIILFLYKSPDKIKMVLHLFGLCFTNGIGWWPKEIVLRALVFLWCIGTYFMTQAYLASLTSYLVDFQSKSMIESLDDLVVSGIQLYCSPTGKEFHCDLESKADRYICENCVDLDTESKWQEFFEKSDSNELKETFAVLTSEQLVRCNPVLKQGRILAPGSGFRHGMLYAGNGTVSLVRNITSAMDRLVESGIMQYWFNTYANQNRTPVVDDAPQNTIISNVRNAFVILYVGWSCSFVVFVIEMLWKRHRGNRGI